MPTAVRSSLYVTLRLLIASFVLPAYAFAGGSSDACSTPTGSSMSLVLLADSLSGLEPGQSVRALAGDTCVGEATYDGQNFAMAVWGNDPIDANGLTGGDPVSLVVAETGTPITGMFEDYLGGDLTFFTYSADAVLLSHRLAVFASGIGFTQSGAAIEQGRKADAFIHLQHTGTVALAGFQLDLLADDVVLDEVRAGDAVDGSAWTFSTAPIEGGIRVIAVNLSGGLRDGTHPVVNLVVSSDVGGTVTIANAVGTLADPAGTDAELGISQGTFTVSVAPRGDLDENGTVNIADFVVGIDVVLGVRDYIDAADVYPFPNGDNRVDVRDLNVLGRAILSHEWPNGEPILGAATRPAEVQTAQQTAQRGGDAGTSETAGRGAEAISLFLHPVAGGYHLGTDQALRALQGTAQTDGEITQLEGANVIVEREGELLHFMIFALSTEPLPSLFAAGPEDLSPQTLTDLVGVTPEGETVPLSVAFTTANEGGPDDAIAFEIYPNPTRDAVRFTRAASGTVYDVLGRRVLDFEEADRLDLNALPAGPYYVRTEEGTFPLTVIQ